MSDCRGSQIYLYLKLHYHKAIVKPLIPPIITFKSKHFNPTEMESTCWRETELEVAIYHLPSLTLHSRF